MQLLGEFVAAAQISCRVVSPLDAEDAVLGVVRVLVVVEPDRVGDQPLDNRGGIPRRVRPGKIPLLGRGSPAFCLGKRPIFAPAIPVTCCANCCGCLFGLRQELGR